jgi:hypothetical protein
MTKDVRINIRSYWEQTDLIPMMFALDTLYVRATSLTVLPSASKSRISRRCDSDVLQGFSLLRFFDVTTYRSIENGEY